MRILGTTALVLATLTLAACGGSSDDSDSTEAPPETPPAKPETAGSGSSTAEGKEVFAANCASCHTLADAGSAGQVGPNLDEAMPSAATVTSMVTNGGNGMPSFSSTLSTEQIQAVSQYVSSVAGK
jgi:mono/diheme cytochrome c family protein